MSCATQSAVGMCNQYGGILQISAGSCMHVYVLARLLISSYGWACAVHARHVCHGVKHSPKCQDEEGFSCLM